MVRDRYNRRDTGRRKDNGAPIYEWNTPHSTTTQTINGNKEELHADFHYNDHNITNTFNKACGIYYDNRHYFSVEFTRLKKDYEQRNRIIEEEYNQELQQLEEKWLPLPEIERSPHAALTMKPLTVEDYYNDYDIEQAHEDPKYIKEKDKITSKRDKKREKLYNSKIAQQYANYKENKEKATQAISDITTSVIDPNLEVFHNPKTAEKILDIFKNEDAYYSGNMNIIKEYPYHIMAKSINQYLRKNTPIDITYGYDTGDNNKKKPVVYYYGKDEPLLDIDHIKSELLETNDIAQIAAHYSNNDNNYYYNYIDLSEHNNTCLIRYYNGNYTISHNKHNTPAHYTNHTTNPNLKSALDTWFKTRRKQ